MSELNDLFQPRFLKTEADVHYFSCKINAHHSVFAGHFPEMPIVPGVCLLNAIKRCVSEIYNEKCSLMKIRECKFLSAINPNEHGEFELQFTLINDDELRASAFIGDTQCVKLKANVSF